MKLTWVVFASHFLLSITPIFYAHSSLLDDLYQLPSSVVYIFEIPYRLSQILACTTNPASYTLNCNLFQFFFFLHVGWLPFEKKCSGNSLEIMDCWLIDYIITEH